MKSTTHTPDDQRGPERFSAPPPQRRRSSPLTVVGAGLALLALVVGVPIALVLWQGAPPVPTGLPSRGDLTQPLSVDALFVVLLVVVWLAWLQFTVCVVVEVVAVVRGGGLPSPVPLSGRSQALARALVGTVLIGSAIVGTSGAASAAAEPPTPAHSPAQVVAAATPDEARDGAPGSQADVADRSDRGATSVPNMAGVPADMNDVVGKKVVVVQPPQGRYHDNLWDISERHLGDGRRWKEVFELNKGRQQPDGQELVIGRLIQPGWVLIMPEDATGVDRVNTVGAAAATTGDGSVTPHAGEAAAMIAADVDYQVTPVAHHESRGLAADLLGGGLMTASLLGGVLMERRRRRSAELAAAEVEAEVALYVGADTGRAERLDRALRQLTTICRLEGLALPPAYAAVVTDDVVELRIAPGAPEAPSPWAALEEGRRWCLARDAADADQRELGDAPYPGLVCLGRAADGADVLIDLESVGGPVAIGGSDAVAREVVSAIAVQLVTAPWTDDPQVYGHGLVPILAELAGDRMQLSAELGPVIDDLERRHTRHQGTDVLSGRLARSSEVTPQYLVLGGGVEPELLERLGPLTQMGARELGVLSAVPVPGSRWSVEVDDSGHLSLPLLGIEVEAVRLSDRSAEEVAGLLAKARQGAGPVSADGVPVPRPPRPGDDAQWVASGVRVGVLGPVEARVPGQMDPLRLELATEVATFLALQPGPVHPNVLAASVWPRGVTAEVRDATIARVREWLGEGGDGSYLLRESEDGKLYLADEVAVDWHAFCTLAQRAQGAVERDARELLRRALQLIRGEFLERRPAGRYAWVPRTRLEGVVADVVESAAHRLVALSPDDPGGAAAAARAGLRAAPCSQLLWRDLLQAEYDGSGGPGAGAVAEEMGQMLALVGAELEPESEALVDELLPGSGARRMATGA